MSHQRKVIRQAIRNLLLDNTAAAAKVYSNRPLPFQDYDLPAIFIYSHGEQSETAQIPTGEMNRTMNLSIEARMKAGDILDDQLDDLAKVVEDLMAEDETFGETALFSSLVSTEMDISSEGVRPIGAIRLNYAIKYWF